MTNAEVRIAGTRRSGAWRVAHAAALVALLLIPGLLFGTEVAAGRAAGDFEVPVLCPEPLHASQASLATHGAGAPTWHPSVHPAAGCGFGHEHGSNPHQFIGFRHSGMPAFGWVAAKMGMQEPHTGFKVFVVNDDGHGKAFMVLLHQGSAGARRASVSRHTLEVWMVDRKTRKLIAATHVMADFGEFVPNCEGQQGRSPMRLIPTVGPGCDSTYESWIAKFSVGGRLQSPGIAFDIENPTTRVDPADLTKTVFNDPAICGPDASGIGSGCTGDRRILLHPRWKIENRGPSVFSTDPMGGHYSKRTFPGSIRQFVRTGTDIDERADCCGPRVSYSLGARRDGVYRLGRTSNVYGFGDLLGVRWPN